MKLILFTLLFLSLAKSLKAQDVSEVHPSEKETYEKIVEVFNEGYDTNNRLLYWGINYDDYKFKMIFDESLKYGIIDSISKVISVEKKKITKSYDNWKSQDIELLKEQIPFLDVRISHSILRANAIKDKDQLINRWGEDSLIVLNRTIELFGLLFLPNDYILTAVRTYCPGKCAYEFITVFRHEENGKLKLAFIKLLSIM